MRACIEHGLFRDGLQKLWYAGPMFRYEKPQKGRYRQFYQLGLEAFGAEGVAIELEMIAFSKRFFKALGIDSCVTLEINTLGTITERAAYRDQLVAYFKAHASQLDADSQARLLRNPLRILDSKNPDMQDLIQQAPKLIDSLTAESRLHFEAFCSGLKALDIDYRVNPQLVRGLDYYEHTVFEWVTTKLGSQATVCAGGRFDKLVAQLGGPLVPAVGFAMGVERLLLLVSTLDAEKLKAKAPVAYIMPMDTEALHQALMLAERMRDEMPHEYIMVHTTGGRFKNQFKKADKSGARFGLILGEEELLNQTVSIKDLRSEKAQKTVRMSEVTSVIRTELV